MSCDQCELIEALVALVIQLVDPIAWCSLKVPKTQYEPAVKLADKLYGQPHQAQTKSLH